MPKATLRNPGMRPDVITVGDDMGRVTTKASFENVLDAWEAKAGKRPLDEVRSVSIDDALVDTGCTLVGLPSDLIHQLGLEPSYLKSVRSAIGLGETTIYSAVRLTIEGRSCTTDVMELPPGVPVLIGQVPLEQLDFVIDMKTQRLVGNPEHGGEHILEAY